MIDWISVDDRLPKQNESVLILAGSGINQSQYVAWIEDFGIENKPSWQYSWCCGCFVREPVKYWQSLPPPPDDKK